GTPPGPIRPLLRADQLVRTERQTARKLPGLNPRWGNREASRLPGRRRRREPSRAVHMPGESLSAGPPVAPIASQRASLSLQENQTHRKVVPPRAADPADHRLKSAASGRRHEQGSGGTSTARALRRPRPPEPP